MTQRRPQRLPHWTHHSDAQAALDAMRADSTLDLRNRAIAETIFATACRTTELRLLAVADIDFDANTITLARHTRRERSLPLTDHARAALTEYLAALPHTGALFVTEIGYRISARLIRRVTPRAPRQLRACVISTMLGHGADLRTVQHVAGHASVTTTARYQQLSLIAALEPKIR